MTLKTNLSSKEMLQLKHLEVGSYTIADNANNKGSNKTLDQRINKLLLTCKKT